jgi:5-methyltetrahydrofolate--homocysteine methyltransferase
MSRFLKALESGRVLLMDGAMGTELRRAGLEEGDCGEGWNLTAPEKVKAVHQAYVDAGAEVLLTNSFQANGPALTRHGRRDELDEITRAAVTLAGAVAGPDRFVLADIGPFGSGDDISDLRVVEQLLPDLRTVDGILLETFSDPLALLIARQFRVVSWADGVPVLLSLAYERLATGELCSRSRHPPEWYALQAKNYGIAALGVNCGRDISLADVAEILRRYRAITDLPLFARPNAGTPVRLGQQCYYPLTPAQFAEHVPALIEAGACMVGGCCGTTPEHIAAMRQVIDARKPPS